jgi:hypothetical protein
MKINLILGISIFSFSFFAFSKSKDENSTIKKTVLEATTQYGDKTSNFIIQKDGNVPSIKFWSNMGEHSEKKITDKDLDFIKSEFKKLPIPPQIPKECMRSSMSITLLDGAKKQTTKKSCFGVNTITEPAYVRFSQILVNAL